MNFKGPKSWPQPMGPLSVLDDHSRYVIVLAALDGTRGEAVQKQLEEAFERFNVESPSLRSPSATLGISHRSMGVETGLPGQAGYPGYQRKEVEDQPIASPPPM
jgi:hypothetical protein